MSVFDRNAHNLYFSFADRDMLHRFTGRGVGHTSTYAYLGRFREDADRALGKWTPSNQDEDCEALEPTEVSDDEMQPDVGNGDTSEDEDDDESDGDDNDDMWEEIDEEDDSEPTELESLGFKEL